MVEGDHELEQGAEVVFRKGELSMPGRVAWVAERRAGIEFATNVDPDMVRRYVPQPRPRIETVHKRPGFRSRLSADELPVGAGRRDRPRPCLGP